MKVPRFLYQYWHPLSTLEKVGEESDQLPYWGQWGQYGGRIGAVFASCVLCLRSAFCVMLGARTMLGATENMEFINIY